MFLVSTKRILKFSWQHFWRNIWLSVVTMTIIFLTLFSLTTLILINVIADSAVNSIKDTVDVSLYFDNKISEESVQLLQQEFSKIEEIKEIKYISPADALAEFKEIHKDDVDISNTLEELKENPLGATLVLKAYRIEDYPIIMENIQALQADELAEKIDFADRQMLIDRINGFASKVRSFGLILSLIFVFIALLTVFNTIRMGIYVHRREIGVMRLVGASNWFIRLPYIIEGVLYAIFGALIFWIVLLGSMYFIGPWLNSFFAGINFDIQAYLMANAFYIFGFELIIISIINVISAIIAMGKYLKI